MSYQPGCFCSQIDAKYTLAFHGLWTVRSNRYEKEARMEKKMTRAEVLQYVCALNKNTGGIQNLVY